MPRSRDSPKLKKRRMIGSRECSKKKLRRINRQRSTAETSTKRLESIEQNWKSFKKNRKTEPARSVRKMRRTKSLEMPVSKKMTKKKRNG